LRVELPDGFKERQEDVADEGALRRRFAHLVAIHERSDGQPQLLLRVALLVELGEEAIQPRLGHVHRTRFVRYIRHFDEHHTQLPISKSN